MYSWISYLWRWLWQNLAPKSEEINRNPRNYNKNNDADDTNFDINYDNNDYYIENDNNDNDYGNININNNNNNSNNMISMTMMRQALYIWFLTICHNGIFNSFVYNLKWTYLTLTLLLAGGLAEGPKPEWKPFAALGMAWKWLLASESPSTSSLAFMLTFEDCRFSLFKEKIKCVPEKRKVIKSSSVENFTLPSQLNIKRQNWAQEV